MSSDKKPKKAPVDFAAAEGKAQEEAEEKKGLRGSAQPSSNDLDSVKITIATSS